MKFPASYSTQKSATYFKQRSPPAFQGYHHFKYPAVSFRGMYPYIFDPFVGVITSIYRATAHPPNQPSPSSPSLEAMVAWKFPRKEASHRHAGKRPCEGQASAPTSHTRWGPRSLLFSGMKIPSYTQLHNHGFS